MSKKTRFAALVLAAVMVFVMLVSNGAALQTDDNNTSEIGEAASNSMENSASGALSVASGNGNKTQISDTEEQTEAAQADENVDMIVSTMALGDSPILTAQGLQDLLGTTRVTIADGVITNIVVNDGDGTYNANDALILLSNTDPATYQTATITLSLSGSRYDTTGVVTVGDVSYSFCGFGSDDNPFKGNLTASGSASPNISISQAMFNALSAGAGIPEALYLTPVNEANSDMAAFADKVYFDSDNQNPMWTLHIAPTLDSVTDTPVINISGVIGNIRAKSGITPGNVTLNAIFDSMNVDVDGVPTPTAPTVNITNTNNAGLLCNTLEAGTLIVNGTMPESFTVISSAGSAGGLVGAMYQGTTLNLPDGAAIDGATITGASGQSAGGLVGSADKSTVTIGDGKTVAITDITIKSAANCGGLFGSYTRGNTGTLTLDDSFAVSGVTLSPAGGGSAGGLFGLLTIEAGELSINSAASSTLSSSAANYGGLVGRYNGTDLTNTLSIETDAVANSTVSSTVTNYGGLVGNVGSGSYLSVTGGAPNMTQRGNTATMGGILGSAGDNCVIKVSGAAVTTKGTGTGGVVNVSAAFGGIAGNLGNGTALQLDGDFDLTKVLANAGSIYGQLVGIQGNSLVYALNGFALHRGTVANDDIGNYGELIRLSQTKLSGLISINETTHRIELGSFSTGAVSTSGVTLANPNDAALLAIYIQSMGAFYPAENLTDLQVAVPLTNAGANVGGSITLGTGIDMSGTGIQGFLRDNGDQTFTGRFDGQTYTLTLNIGEPYGYDSTGAACTAGSAASGMIYRHGYLGMFGKTGSGASISNVTLNGSAYFSAVSGSIYMGGVAGLASGNLSVSGVRTAVIASFNGANNIYMGGLVGQTDNSCVLTMTSCTGNANITDIETENAGHYVGGLLGYHGGTAENLKITGATTLSGSITMGSSGGKTVYARVGGLVAEIPDGGDTTLTLSGITVNGQTITAAASYTCGGLLGHNWANTNVNLTGVSVIGDSSVTAMGGANFGGLVYRASGYWKVAGLSVTSGAFTGNVTPDASVTINSVRYYTTTDGLIICRGDRDSAGRALYLEIADGGYTLANAVTVKESNTDWFDELVGDSMGSPDASNRLDGLSGENGQGIVSVATAGNGLIDTESRNTYINSCSFTGKSGTTAVNPNTRYYYNLDAYRENPANNDEKLLVWSVNQYAAGNLKKYFTVVNLTAPMSIDLTGYSYYPVDYVSDDFTADLTAGGAVITFNNAAIEAKESGLRSTNKSFSQHYRMHGGLFRNASNLTVTDMTLCGSVGMTDTTSPDSRNPWMTGSGALLCGGLTAGSADVKNALTLTNITLKDLYVTNAGDYSPLLVNTIGQYSTVTLTDVKTATDGTAYDMGGQTSAASSLIGNVGSQVAQGITLTFSAMKLDGRQTAGEAYTFGNTTKSVFSKATFLNSFQYASASKGTYLFAEDEDWTGDTHTWEVTYGKEISESIKNEDEQKQYYDNTRNYVNPNGKPSSTDTGANFNGYLPYVAETLVTGQQSTFYHEIDVNVMVSNFINGCGTYGDPYIIDNSGLLRTLAAYLTTGKSNAEWQVNYSAGSACTDGTAHVTYASNGSGTWTGTDDSVLTEAEMLTYMQNAYYCINTDISMQADFMGLGTEDRPFQGVIVGANNAVVTTSATEGSQFGGLILVGNGCVVKDLTINLGAFTAEGPISVSENKAYFGGVIGYIIGGDNIIDNVNVTSAGTTLAAAQSPHHITAGGYVGRIDAGGVIFRNITSAGLTFTNATTGYYYANPYVGRVLDGFAVNETAGTLNNTDKNYQIPTLEAGKTLTVSSGNVTVNDGKGLYVLSALVNSGGASYDGTAFTAGYTTGRVRTATYDNVGNAPTGAELAALQSDENDKIPYLGAAYTSNGADAKALAQLASVSVTLGADCDVGDTSTFGNGFRGIGAIYSDAAGRSLALTEFNGGGHTVTLDINLREYTDDASFAAGAGLFPVLSTAATMHDFTLTGGVSLHQFSGASTTVFAKAHTNINAAVGGAVGKVTSSGNVNFTNITLTALNAQGSLYAGGLVGWLSNATNSTVNITNCAYSDINVSADYDAGGFVGFAYKGAANIALNITWSDAASLTGAEIRTDAKPVSGTSSTDRGTAGGLLGNNGVNGQNNNTLQIQGVSAENPVTLTGLTVWRSGNTKSSDSVGVGGAVGNSCGTTTMTYLGICDSEISSIRKNGDSWVDPATITPMSNGQFESANAGGIIGNAYKNMTLNCVDTYATAGNSFLVLSANVGSGMVGSQQAGATSFTSCTVNGTNAAAGKYYIQSSRRSGGFLAYTTSSVTINMYDCVVGNNNEEQNTLFRTTYSSGESGGFFANNNGSTYNLSGCTLQNVIVASSGASIGLVTGLTSGTLTVQNTTLKNSTALVLNTTDSGYVGALAGTGSGKITGSNILWDGNTLGTYGSCTSSIPNRTLTFTGVSSGDRAGAWVGTNSAVLQLVGVSCQGDNVTEKDVSNAEAIAYQANSSYIVYADYTNAGSTAGGEEGGGEGGISNAYPQYAAGETLPSLVPGDMIQLTSAGATGFSSSNSAIASVNENGIVTAVAEGTATITAAGSGTTWNVSVSASSSGELLTDRVLFMATGTSLRLPVTGGTTRPTSTSTTYSDNEAIATVSVDTSSTKNTANYVGAVVTAVSPGTATVKINNVDWTVIVKNSISEDGVWKSLLSSEMTTRYGYIQSTEGTFGVSNSPTNNRGVMVNVSPGERYRITFNADNTRLRIGTYPGTMAQGNIVQNIYRAPEDKNTTATLGKNITIEYVVGAGQKQMFVSYSGNGGGTVPIIEKWYEASENAVSITVGMSQTEFPLGTPLDTIKNSMTVLQIKEKGTATEISNPSILGYDPNEVGIQTITVVGGGFTATVNITVTGRSGTDNNTPNVVTSPKSTVTVYSGESESSGTTLTGDGACFTTGTSTLIASQIYDDIAGGTASKRYYSQLKDAMESYYGENLSTYNANQSNKASEDFPVLLVDKNSNSAVNAMVYATLNMLSNGGYGSAAALASSVGGTISVDITTYRYNDSGSGKFVASANPSMAWTLENGFRVLAGRNDNDNDQFTLIDISFAKPAGSSSGTNSNGTVYHLYLPVVVKRPVDITFTATLLNSSKFRDDDFADKTAKILADYGDTFTALVEYDYDYSWSGYLERDASGNLIDENALYWNYNKIIQLYVSNETSSTILPAGTKLTLVDANTSSDRAFTYVTNTSVNSIDLSNFAAIVGGDAWSPQPMKNLLKPVTSTDTSKELWVKMASGDDTANMAVFTDSNGTNYRLAVAGDTGTTYELKATESYYLVIETPEAESVNQSALTLTFTSPSKLSSALLRNGHDAIASAPANIVTSPQNLSGSDNSNYGAIYASVGQDVVITSETAGASLYYALDTEGATVNITMTDKLTYSQAYAEALSSTDQRYMQFLLDLNKLTSDGISSAGMFKSPVAVSVIFSALDQSGNAIDGFTTSYSFTTTVDTGELVLDYGLAQGEYMNLVNLLISQKTHESVTVQAEIVLTFSEEAMETFDFATLNEDSVPSKYATMSVSAHLATDTNLRAGNRSNTAVSHGYYKDQSLVTRLRYDADNQNQLGINPNDLPENAATSVIDSTGVCAVEGIKDMVGEASSLVAELRLYRKNDTGAYQQVDADTFIDSVSCGGQGITTITEAAGNYFTWSVAKGNGTYGGFYDSDMFTFTLPITLEVNNDIETISETYANYRVELTVHLVDENGVTMQDGLTPDFFVYTLAKISTGILNYRG